MKLLPASIQGRMLTLAAIATLVALVLAGVIMASTLARVVTQGIDRRLDSQLALLASTVARDGRIDQGHLTELRGALDAGPGWRWQITAPSGNFGSGDLPEIEDGPRGTAAPMPGPSRHPARPVEGRDHEGRAVHGRELRIQTGTGTVVLTAVAPRDVIERPVHEALLPLLVMLAALGCLLALAALWQIRLGLRPVRRLQDAVAAVRAGTAATIEEDQPEELRPLAEELNALIKDNSAVLETARASAANLAHALKTPVATLALDLRNDPRATQVERINATIRHHLSRTRLSLSATRSATPLEPALQDLLATISRLHAGRAITVATSIPAGLHAAIDPADFDELLGNLLDNAFRHARSHVTVKARTRERMLHISVTDDGPGIPPAERQRATTPGVRLDERGDGHGFGLTIAREIAELYGGELKLDQAPMGGLTAAISIPSAVTGRSSGQC